MPEMREQDSPNICKACGQSFNSENERFDHERTVHPGTGSSPEEGQERNPDPKERVKIA